MLALTKLFPYKKLNLEIELCQSSLVIVNRSFVNLSAKMKIVAILFLVVIALSLAEAGRL
jgi:hypothetical protein